MTERGQRAFHYTVVLMRVLVRDRQFLFWNFGFFFVILLVFLGLLSGGEAAVQIALTTALVTIALMANALFSMSIWMAGARESGVFRQYSLTPARAGELLLASGVARTSFVFAAAVSQVLVARFVFSVEWTGTVSGWLSILVVGGAAFTAIGFASAAASSPGTANRNVNLLLIPMMALGGTSLPAAMLPEWWNEIRWLLPVAAVQDGLIGAFVNGDGLWNQLPRLANLAAWMTLAVAVGGSTWRQRGA